MQSTASASRLQQQQLLLGTSLVRANLPHRAGMSTGCSSSRIARRSVEVAASQDQVESGSLLSDLRNSSYVNERLYGITSWPFFSATLLSALASLGAFSVITEGINQAAQLNGFQASTHIQTSTRQVHDRSNGAVTQDLGQEGLLCRNAAVWWGACKCFQAIP